MRTFIKVLILLAGITAGGQASGQYNNLEFVENKGQWERSVTFRGSLSNGALFLQQGGFTVVQHDAGDLYNLSQKMHGTWHNNEQKSVEAPDHKPGSLILHSHSYSVSFLNAQRATVAGCKPLNTFNNYFIGNDPRKWQGHCNIYQAVSYTNMYQGVDVRYYTNSGKLKYDIVVRVLADPRQVAMQYKGADALTIDKGQLVIKTSVGEVRELQPYAYQLIDGVKEEVQCRYVIKGDVVSFAIGTYDRQQPLVIDPTLIFSTLTGSFADNWGYTATFDKAGNFYAGGIVFNTGFPVSTGAYQTDYKGGNSDEEGLEFDIGIIKFSADGTSMIYGTYLGGSGNEQPHSLIVDKNNNLIVAGRSNSDDYPLKNGGLVGPGGNYDITITKFNTDGTNLIGSIKIGGTGRDGVNIGPKDVDPEGELSIRRHYGDDARGEVITDENDDILLASNTSSADFPLFNPFQTARGGKQDGVFIKAKGDLSSVLVSSYLGGSNDDAVFVLAINPTNQNIYLGGNTVSTNLPGDKSGVLYPAYRAGETDGFMSILSPDATVLLKTTYMGTSGSDMLYGLQFDRAGFPYITGVTTGSWPVVNAGFSQAGGKQFIAKLNPNLSAFEYSTVFGTNSAYPNISPTAFLVDRCGNVYVSGWGGQVDEKTGYFSAGTSGLTVTPDAVQSTTDNSDFYFFVLESNATRQMYGSFFGQRGGEGEHVDGGTSRFNKNGIIFQAICANCGGGRGVTFPTTPGAWSSKNNSPNCNLAAVKLAFNLAGLAAGVRSSIQGVLHDTVGCVPLQVDFIDTLGEGKKYIWNYGDNSMDETTTGPSASHTFKAVGTYNVRVVAVDSSKCNITDTSYTTIRVKTFKALLGIVPTKLGPCDSFRFSFANTSTVSPAARSFTDTSFTWSFGDNTPGVTAGLTNVQHSYAAPGTYQVRLSLLDTGFCNAPVDTTITIRVATKVSAIFATPSDGCVPYNAVFTNNSNAPKALWDFGDGQTSSLLNPTHVYDVPGKYRVVFTAVDSSTCNIIDTASTTITVHTTPLASFNFSPDPPLENTPVNFSNNSVAASKFIWKFGDGDTLLTSLTAPVQHTYNETANFNACLIASGNFGCIDSVCKMIAARVLPLLDVPSAFTPNSDGINDKIYVQGFGIRRFRWMIYNRWGTKIFETEDKLQGWDGTYKGVLQPKEVYHYILNVEFSDNTKYQKKGDITLLR